MRRVTKLRRRELKFPQKSADDLINESFSENALKMMRKRYFFTHDDGKQESPTEMFHRVSRALAQVEKNYGADKKFIEKTERDFFEIMSRKEYTPAGRTLTNVGTGTPLIANCIVLPVLDSMESIFQTLKDAAMLQQAGSGLGFDFSHLRPALSPTKKSRGVSSGPVSFLKVYNEAFGMIKQQCFAKGTLIVTKRGLIPIEQVHTGDETFTEQGWNKVTEVFSNGIQETVKLTLDSGFSIELTPNHKVAVIENDQIVLKMVKELGGRDTLLLKLGDENNNFGKLPLQKVSYQKSKYTSLQLKAIRQPEILNEELGYFLGWYFADGWNDAQGIGLVIPDDIEVQNKTIELVNELFAVNPLIAKTAGENCRRLKINSLWVKKFLSENGLLKKHSWEIALPEKILTSPSSVQTAFVAGFFDGDGDNGKNYRIASSSEEFIKQLQLLLLANGIGSKIASEKRRREWRRVYRLSIIGKVFTEKFYEKVSRYSWKIQKKVGTKDFGWIFPFHPIRDLGYEYQDIRNKHDGVRTTISYSVLSQIQTAFLLQRKNTAAAERLEKNNLWLGFVPSKVKSIKPTGTKAVYDFEVEDVHMINAGLYTKNSRHGANMAMMQVDHPDVLDFIRSKEVEGEIRNFNISVKVTDEFMKKLETSPNEQWYCNWNGKKMKPRKVIRARNGSVVSVEEVDITVKQLFDELVHYAWLNGEPGIVFIDEVNRTNPLPGLGPIDCSNPCGEQFLHHYDNCNLGSINLAAFAKDGKVDWARLRLVTKTATRLMDNVIDSFDFPVQKVTDLARKNRRIGLGIMGFADLLYQTGIAYNSPAGIKMAERVMKAITETAHKASGELAKEKGVFANIKLSVFPKKKIKMRNAALTTVAPTGSISMMLDCSSGVEPNFALAYVKQDKDGQQYHYFNKYFEGVLGRYRFSKDKIRKIKENIIKTGSIQNLKDLPEELRRTFVVAMDISADDHIKTQAAFQRYVDNSISKTINFPNSATEEDVVRGYIMAWKMKCKSCTVYRDGSRTVQILNLGTGENLVAPTEISTTKKLGEPSLDLKIDKGRLEPRVRPESMSGRTYKVKTGYGNLYITINDDERGVPFEIFATIGKSGGFFQEQSEAICRMISLSLRSGIKVESVIEQLKGIRGPMPVLTDKGTVLSLPDAIGQVLEEHAKSKAALMNGGSKELLPVAAHKEENMNPVPKQIADYGLVPGCPDCGAPLQMGEGCLSCRQCGFTRCL